MVLPVPGGPLEEDAAVDREPGGLQPTEVGEEGVHVAVHLLPDVVGEDEVGAGHGLARHYREGEAEPGPTGLEDTAAERVVVPGLLEEAAQPVPRRLGVGDARVDGQDEVAVVGLVGHDDDGAGRRRVGLEGGGQLVGDAPAHVAEVEHLPARRHRGVLADDGDRRARVDHVGEGEQGELEGEAVELVGRGGEAGVVDAEEAGGEVLGADRRAAHGEALVDEVGEMGEHSGHVRRNPVSGRAAPAACRQTGSDVATELSHLHRRVVLLGFGHMSACQPWRARCDRMIAGPGSMPTTEPRVPTAAQAVDGNSSWARRTKSASLRRLLRRDHVRPGVYRTRSAGTTRKATGTVASWASSPETDAVRTRPPASRP